MSKLAYVKALVNGYEDRQKKRAFDRQLAKIRVQLRRTFKIEKYKRVDYNALTSA